MAEYDQEYSKNTDKLQFRKINPKILSSNLQRLERQITINEDNLADHNILITFEQKKENLSFCLGSVDYYYYILVMTNKTSIMKNKEHSPVKLDVQKSMKLEPQSIKSSLIASKRQSRSNSNSSLRPVSNPPERGYYDQNKFMVTQPDF